MRDESLQQAIFDHMALAERNKKLERSMPIDRYRNLYGGGGAAKRDELPAEPDESRSVPDLEWDATSERPLPTFDAWDDG